MPRTLMVSLLLLCPIAFGQSTWNGSSSSVWSLAANWTGSVPTANIDAVIPSGTPNSPSTAGVANAACRDLTVNPGATLTAPSGFLLDCARTVTVDGTLAGTGGLRLVGSTNANLGGSGTIAKLEVAKAAGTQLPVGGSLTAGSFTLTSGSFMASSGGATFTVTGNALFQGGVLSVASFTGTLVVGGNVTFSGTNATGQIPPMHCGGNWTADANFAPNQSSGAVVFDGAGAQTISGAGIFHGLTVAAGSVTSGSNLTVNGNLTANGSLAVSGTLDANGDVAVGAAGALDVGGGTDTVAGSLTVDGNLTSTGTVVLDGTSISATLSSASPLPSLQIAKTPGSPLTKVGNVTASSFTLTSGTFQVSSGVLTVTGNALFQGGVLSVGSFTGTVVVAGNVTFSGTNATGQVPPMHCGGNWTADANFAPSSGMGPVTLDGAAQTISGSGIFANLTVAGRSRSRALWTRTPT
jgi:fibronectin-binding autotransporter adhesin